MKTWKLLVAAVMALVMLFAVSALAEATPPEVIGPGPGYCTHSKTYEDYLKPTCTTDGHNWVVCANCGEHVSEEVIPATGHHMELAVEVVPATCTEAGREPIYDCTNDGCYYTEGGEVIEAMGHKMIESVPQVDPTCTEEGRTAIYDCAREGCYYTEGGEVIDALGHDVLVWAIKPATCTEPATETGICERCGEEIVVETAPALGHNWVDDEMFPAVAPTCTEDGLTAGQYCDRCWLVKAQEVVPALGHNWVKDEMFPAVAPTCTESGLTAGYYCDQCWLVKEQEVVDPLGHDWGKWVTVKEATETENGVQERTCDRCGATQTREVEWEGTMPETGVVTVPAAVLATMLVLSMGGYVVLKKRAIGE